MQTFGFSYEEADERWDALGEWDELPCILQLRQGSPGWLSTLCCPSPKLEPGVGHEGHHGGAGRGGSMLSSRCRGLSNLSEQVLKPELMFLALPASLHGQHSSNSTDVAYEEEGDATLAVHPNRAIPVEQMQEAPRLWWPW